MMLRVIYLSIDCTCFIVCFVLFPLSSWLNITELLLLYHCCLFLRGIAQLNSVSYFFHPFVSLTQTLSQPSHNNNARDICLPDSGLHAELLSKDSIIMGFDCLSLNLNNWWLQYLPHYLCVVNIHYGSVFERGVWQRAQGSLAWGELLSVWLMAEMKKYLLITLEKGTVLRSLSAQYAF